MLEWQTARGSLSLCKWVDDAFSYEYSQAAEVIWQKDASPFKGLTKGKKSQLHKISPFPFPFLVRR